MNARFWGFIFLNFCAVLLLTALIAGPLLIAKNMAKVAGVKSESRYLVVSQVEKFPGMIFSQKGDNYQIGFTKAGDSQAFLGVLILNNPTQNTQTYSLETTNQSAQPFFGVDPNQKITKISLPASSSIPISLYSSQDSTASSQTVEFRIVTE